MENTENKELKLPKDDLFERVKTRHADKEFADDDAYFSQISADFEDYDQRISDYERDEEALRQMFKEDPASAQFLADWRNGANPVVAYWERYGADIMSDPEKMEELAEANQRYLERVAKNEELVKEYEINIENSLQLLDDYQAQNGLTDEEVDEILVAISKIVKDGMAGKYSKETIDMVLKAIRHDSDVAQAGLEGEVKGRNTKIRNEVRKREGDGTPRIDGKNNAPQPRRQRLSIFELAGEAN